MSIRFYSLIFLIFIFSSCSFIRFGSNEPDSRDVEIEFFAHSVKHSQHENEVYFEYSISISSNASFLHIRPLVIIEEREKLLKFTAESLEGDLFFDFVDLENESANDEYYEFKSVLPISKERIILRDKFALVEGYEWRIVFYINGNRTKAVDLDLR